MQFVPTSTDRPDGLVLLAAERTVTVTRDEHHQDALAGRTGRVVVELRPCMITSGKHAGRDGLEVTLDGRRVGELTWLMAQRYRPAVDALVVRGFRVGCEALLREDARGIQVELRLPAEPTATRRPVDEPLAVPTSVVTHPSGHPAPLAAAARGRRRGRRGAGGRVRARQRFTRRGADLRPVTPSRHRRGADRSGTGDEHGAGRGDRRRARRRTDDPGDDTSQGRVADDVEAGSQGHDGDRRARAPARPCRPGAGTRRGAGAGAGIVGVRPELQRVRADRERRRLRRRQRQRPGVRLRPGAGDRHRHLRPGSGQERRRLRVASPAWTPTSWWWAPGSPGSSPPPSWPTPGRRVVVVEQEPEASLGGQAHWAFGGLFLVDSPGAAPLGHPRLASTSRCRTGWAARGSTAASTTRRARTSGRASGRAPTSHFAAGEKRAWLHGLGVRFFPVVGWAERGGYLADGHGNSVPRFHVVWGTGPGLLEPFVRDGCGRPSTTGSSSCGSGTGSTR